MHNFLDTINIQTKAMIFQWSNSLSFYLCVLVMWLTHSADHSVTFITYKKTVTASTTEWKSHWLRKMWKWKYLRVSVKVLNFAEWLQWWWNWWVSYNWYNYSHWQSSKERSHSSFLFEGQGVGLHEIVRHFTTQNSKKRQNGNDKKEVKSLYIPWRHTGVKTYHIYPNVGLRFSLNVTLKHVRWSLNLCVQCQSGSL